MNLKSRAIIVAAILTAIMGTVLFAFHTDEMLKGAVVIQILKVSASILFAVFFGTANGLAVYGVEKFFEKQEDAQL